MRSLRDGNDWQIAANDSADAKAAPLSGNSQLFANRLTQLVVNRAYSHPAGIQVFVGDCALGVAEIADQFGDAVLVDFKRRFEAVAAGFSIRSSVLLGGGAAEGWKPDCGKRIITGRADYTIIDAHAVALRGGDIGEKRKG